MFYDLEMKTDLDQGERPGFFRILFEELRVGQLTTIITIDNAVHHVGLNEQSFPKSRWGAYFGPSGL
jgi:hypothetical protein